MMAEASDWMTYSNVSNKIVELVAKSRIEFGIPEGMSGRDACKRLDLRLEAIPLPLDTDGSFSLSRRTVVINSHVTRATRIQFTIYHEIIHYLLERDGELLEYFIENLDGKGGGLYRVIEDCCNMGAAEFLIPRVRVREAIRDKEFSVDLIEYLADQHGASLQASATQLATYAPEDCYVVICVYGPTPKSIFANGLAIEHSAKNAYMKYSWRRGAVIPEDHLFRRVWDGKPTRSASLKVDFRLGNSVPCVSGEAKRIGQNRLGGILWIDPEVPRISRGRLSMRSPSY